MRKETFRLAVQMFLQAKRCEWSTERTAVWYAHQLRLLDEYLRQTGRECIDETVIREFINRRKQGTSLHTAHGTFRALHCFFRWCVAEGLTDTDLMRHTKPPRTPEPIKPILHEQDLHRILQHAGDGWIGERNRALILCLLDTGARIAEACRMRVRDVKSDRAEVLGKGGKARTLYLSARTRAAILRYLNACPYHLQEDDPLWQGLYGPLTPHGCSVILHNIGKRAGIPWFRPHCLRRTFATWALQDGMDMESLRLMLGHSDIRTTERYIRMDDAHLRETHHRFSPLNRLNRRRRP